MQELERQIAELKQRDDEISKKTLERLEQLQTAGDLPFDALMVADGGKRLQQLAALLPFFDVDPAVVLGGGLILGSVIFITLREAQLKRREVTPGVNAPKV